MNWLRAFFRRSRTYEDLSEEIRQHLEEKADELVNKGMPREAAFQKARRDFGNAALIEERSREAWGWRWLEDFFADIRFGARQLARNRMVTAVCMITLALGLGANVAIFSAVYAVLLRPLPFPGADRLVLVSEYKPGNVDKTGSPFVRYQARAASRDLFEETGGYWDVSGGNEVVFGNNTMVDRVQFSIVTSGLFSMLGVEPAVGRVFSEEESAPGGPRVFLASYALWKDHLGGDPSAVGKMFRLDGEPHTLIGVMPAEFRFPAKCDIWMPLGVLGQGLLRDRVSHQFRMIGRLRPGITVERAQAELGALQSQLAKAYPDTDANWGVMARPLLDELVGNVRRTLWVLLAAVGFVLLIACANVIHLLLARAISREREFAIRRAIGAGRLRLVRQTVAESLLVVLGGTALALLLGKISLEGLVWLSAGSIPRFEHPELNAGAFGFCCGLAMVATLLVGMAPGLHAAAGGTGGSLASGQRSGQGSPRTTGLRNILVVAEVALTVALLAAAGVMLRSLAQLRKVDPGFHPEQLVTVKIALPEALYPKVEQRAAFLRQALERLNATPGIAIAAATDRLPLSGERNWGAINIAGQPVLDAAHAPSVEARAVSAGYFHALGIPLRRGRFFTEADVVEARRVTVINQAMADRFWPGGDPVGQRVSSAYHPDQTSEVIGVVGNIKDFGLNAQSPPEMYSPYRWWNAMNLVIRGNLGQAALTTTVRREIAALDPQVPVYGVTSMDEVVNHSVARQHFEVLLLGAFALVALLLAGTGIYGLMAFAVNRRAAEIGLRVALGASPGSILALVLFQGMKPIVAGAAMGLMLSLSLGGLLRGLLFQLSPNDPLTAGVDILVIAAVGALACLIPARRAMRVEPTVALHSE